jgi:hypothetical protein
MVQLLYFGYQQLNANKQKENRDGINNKVHGWVCDMQR